MYIDLLYLYHLDLLQILHEFQHHNLLHSINALMGHECEIKVHCILIHHLLFLYIIYQNFHLFSLHLICLLMFLFLHHQNIFLNLYFHMKIMNRFILCLLEIRHFFNIILMSNLYLIVYNQMLIKLNI